MSLATWLGVAVLGGAGAWLRFRLVAVLGAWYEHPLPVGILCVNLAGCFALGVLAGAAVTGSTLVLLGGGLLGSFTTFSTVMLETVWLDRELHRRAALVNLALSLVGGFAAVAIGFIVGRL